MIPEPALPAAPKIVGLINADALLWAAERAGIDLAAACALIESESGGRNTYGGDAGGVFRGYLGPVTQSNFQAFLWEITKNGRTSNGVGPAQITYKPYFQIMLDRNLEPWNAEDNMTFGFEILLANFRRSGSWERAAAEYNGGPKPNADALAYGKRFVAKMARWSDLLQP